MDWYPWYFQIYEADTMHLTPYQDGCYRRLIDHYMKTRCPIPDSDAAIARIIGDSVANWVAMASLIVRPFFKAKDGKLYEFRCESILDDQDKRARKFSESGKNGAKKRWNKINNKDSHPIATPLAPPMAFDSTRQDKTRQDSKRKNRAATRPDVVSENIWDDFISQRKKAFTETAMKGIEREVAEAGIALEDGLRIATERGWQSFKADWVKTKGNGNEANGRSTKTTRQRAATERAIASFIGENPADSGDGEPVFRQLEHLREGTGTA